MIKSSRLVALAVGVLAGLWASACGPLVNGKSAIDVSVAGGKGSVRGGGYFTPGSKITVTATPASGYVFVKWVSCYGSKTYKTATLTYQTPYDSSTQLYAYFQKRSGVGPKPTCSKGEDWDRIHVKWSKVSGAKYYRVRRGTSSTYSKSVQIAQTSGNSYVDMDAACKGPGRKYYYWILPVYSDGVASSNPSNYGYGYSKKTMKVYGASKLKVRASYRYGIKTSPCQSPKYGSYRWKVVSGSSYGRITSVGGFAALKPGKVVIQCTYSGVTYKKTITVVK